MESDLKHRRDNILTQGLNYASALIKMYYIYAIPDILAHLRKRLMLSFRDRSSFGVRPPSRVSVFFKKTRISFKQLVRM